MWEQLASEIFVTNLPLAQWHWTEPLAIPLLDYWAEFDHAIRFVLVVETPLQTAIRLQKQEPVQAIGSANIALQQWQQSHHVLLRFALRHPQRCMLLWDHHIEQPAELAHALQTQWGLQINSLANPNPAENAKPKTLSDCILALHLGQMLCQDHPAAQQLLSDLHANVPPLLGNVTGIHASATSPLALISRYQQLKELGHQAAQIPILQLNLKKQIQKTTAVEKTCNDLQVQHQTELSQLQSEVKQAQEQAKAANAQYQSAQQKLQTELKQAQDKAQAASAQHKSEQQQLQTELKQAQVQVQKQNEVVQAAHTEKEQLLKQNHESKEEAELLLNQLHVVQEELENYFYRNKELQAQATALTHLQHRWQQLFTHNPDLYAVGDLRIESGQAGEYLCDLSQLDIAGRHFDHLDLTLQLQPDGSAVMMLKRPADGPGPLLRWPTEIAPGATLTLQPQLYPDTPPQLAAAFIQLTSSDWQLVQQLHRLLLAALTKGLPNLPAIEQQLLHIALQQSQQHLQSLRNMLRFDTALSQPTPTVQMLHLQLQGISLQALHSPVLELQLSQHTPQHYSLMIGPSPLTASGHLPPSSTLVHLTPNGWYTYEPAPAPLPNLLAQLMGILPLALVDAVHNGSEKASLKPWADSCRSLRKWPQIPCDPPPLHTPAPSKPTKPKATTEAKTTSKTKVISKAKPNKPVSVAEGAKPRLASSARKATAKVQPQTISPKVDVAQPQATVKRKAHTHKTSAPVRVKTPRQKSPA